jgi:LemA protein
MKKKIGLFVIAALLIISVIYFLSAYNSLIKKDEAANSQWAQVETQYERRIALIPNLVNTVKGYMQFESGLLQNITALRSRWINSEDSDEKTRIASDLDNSLSRLLLIYENYPELKSIVAVQSLMDELSGTENRISVERKRYNDAVQTYNIAMKTFPSSIVAQISGFKQKQYFRASEGSQKTPEVAIY